MRSANRERSTSGVALAYVGGIVPDYPRFHNAAFSRAGTMFQYHLLSGLVSAGLPSPRIYSVRPLPSFPRSRRIFVGKERVRLDENLEIVLLPFLNITPLKQLLVGLATFVSLLFWGWQTRKTRSRVVYTFNLTVPPGLFTLCAARIIGARTLVSLNDIHVPDDNESSSLFQRIDFWLHKKLIPRFDGHVAVADRIMSDFAPGKPYIRIEGGISHELLNQTLARHGTGETAASPFIIVTAGRLDETNGIHLLLEGFSQLEGDQYRLSIAGTGPLEEQVRSAAARDPRIRYYGFLSFAEVLDLYASASLLINMRLTKERSTQYFYPSKMMEYLASGRPVLTTNTGHTEEEFGDFVFLLHDESAAGLAEGIRKIVSVPESDREAMGQSARDYMLLNKTWEAQGRKLLEYIQETVL